MNAGPVANVMVPPGNALAMRVPSHFSPRRDPYRYRKGIKREHRSGKRLGQQLLEKLRKDADAAALAAGAPRFQPRKLTFGA